MGTCINSAIGAIPMKAWDVYLNGNIIETVFFDCDCGEWYVYRSLVDHDGFDSRITVKEA